MTTNIDLNKYKKVHAGKIQAFAVQTLIDFTDECFGGQWLVCDGRQFNSISFPNLFNKIGYFYGGASNMFSIPNINERVIAGASCNEPIKKIEGFKTHTLTIAEMPKHNHGSGNHKHKMSCGHGGASMQHHGTNVSPFTSNRVGIPAEAGTGVNGYIETDNPIINSDNVILTEGGNVNTAYGASVPHNNMQPTIYLGYFIYAV